jgi:hypothetical protein
MIIMYSCYMYSRRYSLETVTSSHHKAKTPSHSGSPHSDEAESCLGTCVPDDDTPPSVSSSWQDLTMHGGKKWFGGALNHFHHVGGLKSGATTPTTDGEDGSLGWRAGGGGSGSGDEKQWLMAQEKKNKKRTKRKKTEVFVSFPGIRMHTISRFS